MPTKMRSSTKIAIAFAALMGGGYYGYKAISGYLLDRIKFDPIKPGNVNIVGVDTSKGYYIVVANQIAQLVMGEIGNFQAGDPDESASSDSERKRVPIHDLLKSLQGDEMALGKFIMSMNNMSDRDFPAYPRIWKSEDVERAIESDPELLAKLEQDLNVKLDGTPLETVRISALEEGIVLDSPVEVEAQVGAERKRLVGRVQQQYSPRFCMNVWDSVSQKSNLTQNVIIGSYREAARAIFADPKLKEDVKESILGRISPQRMANLARIPQTILDSAQVIVNDGLIERAEYESYRTNDGKTLFNINLFLNEEGRKRLWQYSKRQPNAQLLFTWEGIAIAAPRIRGELALSKVTISQLADETLVRDAVDSINQARKE